jgi:hypothetical protein
MAIEKIERHIAPGTDRIPTALIKAGGRKICCGIQKLTHSIWKKKELAQKYKESLLHPFIRRVIIPTVVFT